MIGLFAPDVRRRKSPLVMILLLIGAVAWLAPMVAAARRPRPSERQVKLHEVVLPVTSPADDVCVQGTSIAGSRRFAVIDGRVVRSGEQIDRDGARFLVVEIRADSVRLQPVSAAEIATLPAEPARR